ncbi:MFS transporter [Acidicapsa acidisoli]|uniref:MFS transporter n=1 Tax=Acidicapsa acidisoli TaxID=1615681 RepID=UPI0021E04392|nr:MFS transporter [Acidicapsa acidisoli]
MTILKPPRYLSGTIIYLSFAATGVGMALPGSVLPILLAQWSLADRQAGLLLFLGWLGSSLGALVVRPSRVRSLAAGAFLAAIGAVGMAYSSSWSCFLCMAVFGLGLGLTMTSTSLLQASRHPLRRGAELNRLNLVWALGACICPTLATHSLRIASARAIFSFLGLFFALVGLWTLLFEPDSIADSTNRTPLRSKWSLALWPLTLVLAIGLPTGIESSMGGWIAAYVQRTQQTISTTVTAGSCFWVGLMLSRMLASSILMRRRSERLVLIQSLCTVVAGTLMLIASKASLGMLAGVFLVGFGLGPVYPLLLAIALQFSDNSAIFFVAGLGSAFFPWLTGIVSSSTSSLRTGLVVPLTASVLMLILGLRLARLTDPVGLQK